MSDGAFLDAMVAVEQAWLDVLIDAGVAPAAARTQLAATRRSDDCEIIACASEIDANPVSGLVTLLRERSGGEAARWLHRGLTSQDVVDTALMVCLRDALSVINGELIAQMNVLAERAAQTAAQPLLARTLTQPALPSTVGAKLATWLSALTDAADAISELSALPVQVGGAAGTRAAATELTGSPDTAGALADALAAAVGLRPAMPWHTRRTTITRAGDALVTCCDIWGHIAADVLIGARAEVGEFSEGRSGGSSTMPHKNNPTLSVLIRCAALTAPSLGAALHAASAASVDERSDGGWHAEWATLRTLTRRTAIAASQSSELLSGLIINTERAAANLANAGDLLGEQRVMTDLTGRQGLPSYTGATAQFIDAAIQRAARHVKETL